MLEDIKWGVRGRDEPIGPVLVLVHGGALVRERIS
jgi:hypothetical protein